MSRIERIIAMLAGLTTIGGAVWGIIRSIQSKPIPLWFYLSSVIAGGILGFCVGRFWRIFRRTPSLKLIGTVTFNYLPDFPVNHGWSLGVDEQDGTPPSFHVATDAPLSGALTVVHTSTYYMDYAINQTLGLSNLAEFFIRFANESAFYLRVSLSTRDASQQRAGWLCYIPDSKAPRRANAGEWSVPISGDVLANGWIDARLSIADDVGRTYGTEGWMYVGLKTIRLRGSLALSTIKLSRIEVPNNEVGRAKGRN